MHNSAINYIHVNIKNACVMVLTLTVQEKIIFECDEQLDDDGQCLRLQKCISCKVNDFLYFESDILWSQLRGEILVTIRLHYPWLWSYGTQSCPSLVCNQKRMLHSETQYFFCSHPTKALFLSLLPLEIMIKMKNLFQHYEGKMFLVRM